MAPDPPTRPAPARQHYSLRTSLILLAGACVLPAALISSALLYNNYRLRHIQVEQNTILTARMVVADLERELAAIESALKVLATAQELANGDLAAFHRHARDALALGIVANYVLTSPDGRQRLNARIPFGRPLPTQRAPEQLDRVFRDGETVLTDLIVAPDMPQPAIALGVPVRAGDQVIYSLNVRLTPARLNDILARHTLPEGWLIAILDTSGTIAGRTREADRFVGQKAVQALIDAVRVGRDGNLVTRTKEGIAVYTAFARSERWRWAVAVGAPVTKLEQELTPLVWGVVAGTTATLLVGLGLALVLARRVVATVRVLNQAAAGLRTGETVRLPEIQFTEAGAVGEAITEAARAMGEVRYLAQHDALTGLANRWLFFESANRQLALAARNGAPLAVVAVDLDGFKAVNDTQGHAAGDAVLKDAASRILDTIRASDLAARLGGDEFVILLADTDATMARQSAERIVARLAAPYPETPCPVSASAGVATFPGQGNTLDALMRQADRALYAAKAAGKNGVAMA